MAYSVPSDSGAGAPQNTYSTVARVDYNFSDKTTLYGRYALYSEDDFAGYINSSPYVGYDTGQTNFNQSVTDQPDARVQSEHRELAEVHLQPPEPAAAAGYESCRPDAVHLEPRPAYAAGYHWSPGVPGLFGDHSG